MILNLYVTVMNIKNYKVLRQKLCRKSLANTKKLISLYMNHLNLLTPKMVTSELKLLGDDDDINNQIKCT